MNTLYYKKYIEKLINANPSRVTIIREEKVKNDYGGFETIRVEKEATVTFYETKTRREAYYDAGPVFTGSAIASVTKILASNNTDIKKGDTVVTAEGNNYKVLMVHPYFDICKQIDTEVV